MSSERAITVGVEPAPVQAQRMPPVPAPPPAPPAQSQVARARFAWGPVATEASIAVTPAGLLAAGGMVALILLSIAPIIRAARTPQPPAED